MKKVVYIGLVVVVLGFGSHGMVRGAEANFDEIIIPDADGELLGAIIHNDFEAIDRALMAGANINTGLHFAVSMNRGGGEVELVQYLVNKGADIADELVYVDGQIAQARDRLIAAEAKLADDEDDDQAGGVNNHARNVALIQAVGAERKLEHLWRIREILIAAGPQDV